MKASLKQTPRTVTSRSTNARLALLAITVFICCAIIAAPAFTSIERGGAGEGNIRSSHSKGALGAISAIQQKENPQNDKEEGSVKEIAQETFAIPLQTKGLPGRIFAPQVAAVTELQEVEPNGTSGTAQPLGGTSVKVTGNVIPNGDLDYYSFPAVMGDRVYAAVQTSFSASASTDSILELFDTNGTTVLEGDEDDGSFGSLSSSIANVTIPANGTYFLRVKHNSATVQLRPYYLWFQLQSGSPTPETEPNDTFPGQALPASGWVSGSTSSATDVDFYSMSLNAGDTVYLSLDLDPERNGDWNGQLGFGAFGGFNLLVNDSGAGFAPYTAPDSEAFFMTVQAAGTYAILVSVPTGATPGTYTLSASVLPAANRGINCTTYTSTDVPKPLPDLALASSTLTVPGNPRIEHMQVSIQANHTFMADLDFELVSPTGNVVGLMNDIGNATVGGPTVMNLTLDDYAGVPPSFAVTDGMIYQPELSYRLDWFKGQPAGGVWTLRIRDDASGDIGTLTGWSIRICEPPAPPACSGSSTTVFSTDFEASAAGFTHSGTLDEWERGLPATVATSTTNPVAGLSTANSGTNCWKTDLDNTYDTSSSQDLLSPNINLAGLNGPVRLNWAQWFQMDTSTNDHAWVDVRIVGMPATAVRVWEWRGATMTLAVGSPAVNIGESAGWGLYNADISSFAGQNIEVLFHLDSGTGVTNFAGLAIDDVSVTACLPSVGCTLTCPANVTQTNDPNQCGAVVTYPPPTTTGSCGTVTCSPASGSFFPVGTTTVTCTATGGGDRPAAPGGNQGTCTFTVTVTDDQPPTITCPANITKSNDPNQCGAVVNYPPPTITDNCPGMFTATCTPASGSFFPVGTTTVSCTVDGFRGGATSAPNACTAITESSSQAITPLNSVSCNDGIGHTDNSYWRAFTLSSFGIGGAWDVQSVDIGIEDASSGGAAPPTKVASSISGGKPKSKTAKPSGAGQPITVRLWTSSMPFPTGFPGSLTMIGSANVNVADQGGTILNIPVTGTAPAGSQLVVEVFTPDGETAGNLFFIGSNASPETGPSYLSAADCGITTPTTTAALGFPDMHIVMNVNGCTQATGTGPTCTFTVTVNDTQPPTITCPANIFVAAAASCPPATSRTVNFTTTASDNCPGVTVVCTPPSGSIFPTGTTTVTCTATDASGNTATCSFTVTVFSACLVDESNPGNVVLFNAQTGEYRFCCSGQLLASGTGVLNIRGCIGTIDEFKGARKAHIEFDFSAFGVGRGTASLFLNGSTNPTCKITDQNMSNNQCTCPSAPPTSVGVKK